MKSMINEAKFTKRYNLGDYEFEEFTLGAIVDESESGARVLTQLKLEIGEAYAGSSKQLAKEPVSEDEPKTKKSDKKSGKKEEKKNAKTSIVDDEANNDENSSEQDDGDDGESDQDNEGSDGENGDDSDDSADASESGEEEGEEEESKPKSKAKKGGKKVFKAKSQAYNRSIEQHKKVFGDLLGSVSPDWKKSEKTKMLAKSASAEMEGVDFLDGNGEVLPAFQADVAKLMKSKKK